MNYKEANSVKDLAKENIQALRVITKRKCSNCDGYGVIDGDTPGGDLGCGYCNGSGKEHWKWKPEIFDLYYFPIGNGKIRSIDETTQSDATVLDSAIPILDWEQIERVLEEALGARFEFSRGREIKWVCSIELHQDRFLKNGYYQTIVSSSKSRTKAVYEAVIGLEKKLKEKVK